MGRILRDDAMSAEFSLKESARNDFHAEIDHVQRQDKNGFYTTLKPGKMFYKIISRIKRFKEDFARNAPPLKRTCSAWRSREERHSR